MKNIDMLNELKNIPEQLIECNQASKIVMEDKDNILQDKSLEGALSKLLKQESDMIKIIKNLKSNPDEGGFDKDKVYITEEEVEEKQEKIKLFGLNKLGYIYINTTLIHYIQY